MNHYLMKIIAKVHIFNLKHFIDYDVHSKDLCCYKGFDFVVDPGACYRPVTVDNCLIVVVVTARRFRATFNNICLLVFRNS